MAYLVFLRASNAAPFPEYAPGVAIGQVTDNDLKELSGLVASRNNAGVFWVHNDGPRDLVYAIGRDGQLLGTYDLSENILDFEDIARGPGPEPELDYLYFGDIGDNTASRNNIDVFRAPEPAVYSYFTNDPVNETVRGVEKITFTYPNDEAYDAEALLVDPLTGDLYIATKQPGVSRIYRATAAQLIDGASVPLSFVREVPFDSVAGGDIAADGSQIILRQEFYAQGWVRNDGQSVADALGGTPTNVPVIGPPTEPNGEAVTFAPDGSGYYTISEGEEPIIYYFARQNFVPDEPLTLVAPAAQWRYLDHGTDAGVAWRSLGFNDSAWGLGAGQFGYEQSDQQTVLSFGPDQDAKYVTTYFRKSFVVDDPARVAALTMRLLYDDGVAVYLNGVEVHRRNLAPNAAYLDVATLANTALENIWQTFALTPQSLHAGVNTVAVEVHRRSLSENDLSFDLQLFADVAEDVLRLVNPPRRLLDGRWFLEARGADGTVAVERSSNLMAWGQVGELTISSGSGTFSNLPPSGAAFSFYRLRRD